MYPKTAPTVSRKPASPPVPPPAGSTAGSNCASTITEPIRKITASTGNAIRSNACTRLCPKNATPTCTTTTMTSASTSGIPVSSFNANDALTLLTANHPQPDVIVISPAGSTLPR